jgi:hypothetical protein
MLDGIEDYAMVARMHPAVAERINAVWGTDDFHPYLETLTQERKRTTRAGFSIDVLLALSELQSMHDVQYPDLAPPKDSFWDSAL